MSPLFFFFFYSDECESMLVFEFWRPLSLEGVATSRCSSRLHRLVWCCCSVPALCSCLLGLTGSCNLTVILFISQPWCFAVWVGELQNLTSAESFSLASSTPSPLLLCRVFFFCARCSFFFCLICFAPPQSVCTMVLLVV